MTAVRSRIFSVMIVIMLLTLTASAVNIPSPNRNFCVGDFADVISSSTADYIAGISAELEEQCGAQIVVVTVNGLGGENIERYATALFNEWGIGSAENNNGVLFLMALAEDDYWTVQGRGLENSLTSGMLGVILDDYVEPYFAEQDYDSAARAFTEQVAERLIEIYGLSYGGEPTPILIYDGDYCNDDYYGYYYYDDYNHEYEAHEEAEHPVLSLIIILFVLWIIIRALRNMFGTLGGFLGLSLLTSRPRRGFFRGTPPPPPPRSGFNHSSHYGSFGGSSSHSSRSSFGGSHSSHGGGGSTRGGGAGRGRR